MCIETLYCLIQNLLHDSPKMTQCFTGLLLLPKHLDITTYLLHSKYSVIRLWKMHTESTVFVLFFGVHILAQAKNTLRAHSCVMFFLETRQPVLPGVIVGTRCNSGNKGHCWNALLQQWEPRSLLETLL
jgi:hypothetical protein